MNSPMPSVFLGPPYFSHSEAQCAWFLWVGRFDPTPMPPATPSSRFVALCFFPVFPSSFRGFPLCTDSAGPFDELCQTLFGCHLSLEIPPLSLGSAAFTTFFLILPRRPSSLPSCGSCPSFVGTPLFSTLRRPGELVVYRSYALLWIFLEGVIRPSFRPHF